MSFIKTIKNNNDKFKFRKYNKINNNTLEYNYKIKKYSRRFRKGSFEGILLSRLKRDYNFMGNGYIGRRPDN